MSCSSSNYNNSRASSCEIWPLPANAGSTVSHKEATCITSLSWIWTAGGRPVSDAHASRELEPLVFKINANSRLFMLLGLIVCPIVNRYDFAVMSRWSRRKWNKIKIWPRTNGHEFEAQWAAMGQGLPKLEKYSLVPGFWEQNQWPNSWGSLGRSGQLYWK